MSEAVENLGGTLLEMVEIEDFDVIFSEMTESEIFFLNDSLIEEVVHEVFSECLDDGYELDEIENVLIESLEISSSLLNEAKVTLGHDTKIKSDRLEKVKSAVKKTGKAIARGAGNVVGTAVRGAKAVGREFKKGYERGRGGSSSGSSSSSSQTSSPSNSGSSKPSLLSRIGSKLKSGLKKAVASGARAVSRGARNVARRMEGGETKNKQAPKAAPKVEPKKAEKPEDPWGKATVPPKAKAKPKAAPKAKTKSVKPEEGRPAKRRKGGPSYDEVKAGIDAKEKSKKKVEKKSKLDDLLSSIRSEHVQIDEKTLSKMEMKKREEIVKSMKDKASDFEKRYPGRGKEVMYATATKMAKKMVEQTMSNEAPITEPVIDKKKEMLDKQKLANMKILQQKQETLRKKELRMKMSGKLPLEAN